MKKYAEATLGSGNLRMAVVLPEGEDLNEWLAVNSASFISSSRPPESRNEKRRLTEFGYQRSRSLIKSTCSTAPSRNFVRIRNVPSCAPDPDSSIIGRTALRTNDRLNFLLLVSPPSFLLHSFWDGGGRGGEKWELGTDEVRCRIRRLFDELGSGDA